MTAPKTRKREHKKTLKTRDSQTHIEWIEELKRDVDRTRQARRAPNYHKNQ